MLPFSFLFSTLANHFCIHTEKIKAHLRQGKYSYVAQKIHSACSLLTWFILLYDDLNSLPTCSCIARPLYELYCVKHCIVNKALSVPMNGFLSLKAVACTYSNWSWVFSFCLLETTSQLVTETLYGTITVRCYRCTSILYIAKDMYGFSSTMSHLKCFIATET